MNNIKNVKIVCLGGGIGTVNLIKGLKNHTANVTVIHSMADEGGSSGRLRRIFDILPPGDIVSCMSAFANKSKANISDLLTYRFPGDRYGKDGEISGQKLGNLIMVGLYNLTGDFEKSVSLFQEIFDIPGKFLPVTLDKVSISAITSEGKEIFGEEKIDLGKYNGKKILEKVILHPENVKPSNEALKAIEEADLVIAGPGDLYTTILPVLITPGIKEAIEKSRAQKIFIINIANKPFETKNYTGSDYVNAVKKHLGEFIFNKVIFNDNFSFKIPKKYHYSYVNFEDLKTDGTEILKADLVNKDFPLYHSSEKLANFIIKNI